MIKNAKIEKLAKELYDSQLPYHNFEHALKAVETGLQIARRCEKEGMGVNKEVIYFALLFHDAGYHINHKDKGFDSKEEYSAFLAKEVLQEIGVKKNIIKLVQKAILATMQGAEFYSTEDTIVRVADLAEIASDYEQFCQNNKKLKKEAEILTGQKISWEDWKKQTKKVVEFYLSQNIKLTGEYENEVGESVFHVKAKENLKRFLN